MSLILLPFKESVVVKLCEDQVFGRRKVVFKGNSISSIGVFCETQDVSWFLGASRTADQSAQSDGDVITSDVVLAPGSRGSRCRSPVSYVGDCTARNQHTPACSAFHPSGSKVSELRRGNTLSFQVRSHPACGQRGRAGLWSCDLRHQWGMRAAFRE